MSKNKNRFGKRLLAVFVATMLFAGMLPGGTVKVAAASITTTVNINDGTNPLDDVTVTVTDQASQVVGQTKTVGGSATFSLDDQQTYTIKAESTGYYTVTKSVTNGTGITISMADVNKYFTFHVTDGTNPINGASISGKTKTTIGNYTFNITTDSNGNAICKEIYRASIESGIKDTSSSFTVTMNGYNTFNNTTASTDSPEGTNNITLTPALVSIKTQPVAQDLKVGEKMTLSVAAEGATTYQWYKKDSQDVAINNATGTTFEIASVSLSDAGDYYCKASGPGGEATSDTVKLSVNKNATAVTLSASPASGQTRPNAVTLTAGNIPSDATGNLIFKYGTTEIGTVDLEKTKSITFNAVGSTNSYSFTVEYTGDGKYDKSTSASLSYDFTKGEQTTALQLDNIPTSKVYGDADFTVSAAGGDGTGEVVYGITEQTDADGKTTTDVANINASTGVVSIIKAGKFKVTAVKSGDDDYNAGTLAASDFITVSKKELTIDVQVNNKPYDGLDTATISQAKLVGVVSNDNVSLIDGTPTFASVNTGDNININFTPFTISGDINNYTLTQPTGVKANITEGFTSVKGTHYTLSAADGTDNWYKSNDFVITAAAGYKVSLDNVDDSTKWSDNLTYSADTANGTVEFYVRNTTTKEISSKVTETYAIDKTAPTNLTISYSTPIVSKLLQAVTFGFYQAPAAITVSAEDGTSGIDKIDYSFVNKAGDADKNNGGSLTDFTKTGSKYESSFTVPAQFKGQVSITAVDKAGNSTVKTETDKGIVVDNIAPKATVEYNAPVQTVSGIDYYSGNVTATVKITEANFLGEDVKVTVKKTDDKGTVTDLYTDSNTAISDWKQSGDDWTGTLTLSGNGDYEITINYKDESTNEMSTYTRGNITIDTAQPVVSVKYDNNNALNGNYYNADRTATITINEHNFRASDVAIAITAKDILGNDVKQPTISSWTNNGDVHTAAIAYTADANYTFGIDYKDLANNSIDAYPAETFTVDKTAPANLTIAYSTPIVSKLLQAVTFGFYKAPATVTVSADDSTSEIDKIDYSFVGKVGDTDKNNGGSFTTFTKKGNSYENSFTVPAQFKGLVSVTAVDKAGNSTIKTETENGIVVDTISPTAIVSYNTPTQTVNNVDYYNGDVTATIKITEANFISEDVKVTVDKTDNTGSVTKLYDASSTAINNWTQSGDEYTGTLTLSGDGDYEITIDYTDKSTNAMNTYSRKGITIDTAKPEITSVVYDNNSANNTSYYKANRTAAITITEHNFRASDVVITMTAKDILGNDVTLPTPSDWTSNGDVHTATIAYTADANYTFDIDYKDLAKNNIDDYPVQAFTVDKISPSNLTIAYSTPIVSKLLQAVTFGFYQAPATVTVSADDSTSGIDKIDYSFVNKVGDTDKNNGGSLTAFTKTGDKYESRFTVPAQFKGLVTITAVDKAGNSTIKTETENGIVVDTISPTATVSYNAPVQTVNGVDYYGGNVTATVKVTEANFFSEDVKVTVKKTDDKGTVTDLYTDSNTAISDWKQSGDDWTGTLTLSGDGDYEITIDYTDKSTNAMSTYTKKGITIDTIKPEITSVVYDNNSANNTSYYKANRTAAITITEHNFRASDVVITMTAKDILGNDVTLPTPSDWTSNGDVHTATIAYTADANYTFDIDYKDLAKNNIVDYGVETFTVDKVMPSLQQGNIVFNKKNDGIIARFINFISFGYFCNEKVNVTITAADETSGVDSIEYYATDDKTNKVIDDVTVKNLGSSYNTQSTTFELPSDFKGYVFAKAIDRSNNETTFVKSRGLIVESTEKHNDTYEMSITPEVEANSNGFYNGDLKVDLYIKDSYSGINSVTYTVGSSEPVTETFEATDDSEIKTEWKKIETIKASSNNNNDVVVKVEYKDNAGNPRELMQTFKADYKIDITKPVISVAYDNNTDLNDKFYKDNRTATITIDELNFKNDDVIITSTKDGIDQRITPSFSTNGNLHTMQIPYNTDGDYTLTVAYTDLAGNKADYNRVDEFTIDKTNPVISVTYDNNSVENGNYYKADRIATVKVVEHNWNLQQAAFNLNLKAEKNPTGEYVQFEAPKLGQWQTEGDIHTATIHFAADGRYTLSASFTDVAGNKAANINEQVFVIDKTKPSVPQSLSDLNISSYINGKGSTVAPKITVKDDNYDINKISLTISGYKDIHKNMTPKGTWSNTVNGRVFTFDNFVNDKNTDDIYTIKVSISDKAGNAQESVPLQFSVNRFGSTYDMSKVKDINNGYFKAAKDVVITEINPNKIAKDAYILTLSRNGNIRELVLDKDYNRDLSEQAGSFSTYTYNIKADNFKEDGKYVITLQSKDEAKNENSNDDEEKNGASVSFIVDNTKPTAAVSGIEKGKTYSADSIKATITITDNIKLYSDTNTKDNNIVFLLNGKKVEGTIIEDTDVSKKYEVEIKSGFDRQTLQISFKDQSGNENSVVVGDFLVNSSILVQYYQNKPLFYGSISSVIVFILGFIAFLKVRKRKIVVNEKDNNLNNN